MELLLAAAQCIKAPASCTPAKGTNCRRCAAAMRPGTSVHGRTSPQAVDWRPRKRCQPESIEKG
ncbi:hypothetical protein EAS61_00355 [Bradyrhizobium zhanjiangense]|uniref:Uncharacterized protein n=1 Tax=Bradyrhizobium zhanjiangense TaxID=1325107 RepID=A0A4Q0QZ73_9BRAD|nr:hypothetical protein EAS62_13415 [Bradyrhizobium zhanjiangense]RXH02978.1 hypothetical protein EAS61_00355 [Bradyrhizobium zhanjiangense]